MSVVESPTVYTQWILELTQSHGSDHTIETDYIITVDGVEVYLLGKRLLSIKGGGWFIKNVEVAGRLYQVNVSTRGDCTVKAYKVGRPGIGSSPSYVPQATR